MFNIYIQTKRKILSIHAYVSTLSMTMYICMYVWNVRYGPRNQESEIRNQELGIRMGTTGAAGWIDEIPDPSLREIDENR